MIIVFTRIIFNIGDRGKEFWKSLTTQGDEMEI